VRILRLGATFLAGLSCLSSVPVPSFTPSANRDAESAAKAELLALHQADRRAHFGHDVDAFPNGMEAEVTMVRDGKVEAKSRDEVRKRFTEYFQGTTFSAWDDLEPPIIQVSPDSKMGWMIVRVRIAYTKTDGTGVRSKEDTVMAWMSAYEKHDGKWLLVANATTVQP
jgi:uncharacterized protein (TIGR02246 family)